MGEGQLPACDPDDRYCTDGRGGQGGGGTRGGDGADAGGRDTVGASDCDLRACEEFDRYGVARPDTDSDGIPDCVEGGADPDGDGLASCVDDDSDGDGIPDELEGDADSDGDGTLDIEDLDSDGDNIPDEHEPYDDPDEDGLLNHLDPDSDGDGWPDAAEYGREIGSNERPVDRDGDGIPDFLDLDSDGDGLADENEQGCPTSTDRTKWDTDDDGYNDLVEVAFGANPCDPADDISDLVDFYFELPFRGSEQTDVLEFGTDVQTGDIVFNMDTTGSMSEEISELRASLESTLIPELGARLETPGYAVTRFDDFPCDNFGSRGDVPFGLIQRVTLSRGDARSAVYELEAGGGGDGPESGFESLYQIATGVGHTRGCYTIPPFDSARGWVEDVADGTIGGVGFREGSMPIVVQITDNSSHDGNVSGYPGVRRNEAYDALGAIGARVIGVASGSSAERDLTEMANRTGAVVPACAWDGDRPGNCGAGQCCTGSGGRGVAANASGECPLVFSIDRDGDGLDTSIVSGIDALINFAPIDVTAVPRRDPDEPIIDTSCFLKEVAPLDAIAAEVACTSEPAPADFDGDGTPDGFTNVTPGTQLTFSIVARNDTCAPALNEPQVFLAYIDVVGDGSAVLDTQVVTILVPPNLKR